MFANSPEIAEPRRIFSGRRSRMPHLALKLVVVTTVLGVACYAVVATLNLQV